MDDRELLELAAKAVGYDTSHPWNAERLAMNPPVIALCVHDASGLLVSTGWNPIANDDHALRLAVRLHIDVSINNGAVEAVWIDEELSETHCVDVYCDEAFEGWPAKEAAVRRAIVRAAAEIGARS